eukprot:scaffold118619_cov72-Phaeocystis_antarctica.AAC.2
MLLLGADLSASAAQLRGVYGARLLAEVGGVVRRGGGLGLEAAAGVARSVEGRVADASARALFKRHCCGPRGRGAGAVGELGGSEAADVQLVPPHAHYRRVGRGSQVAPRQRRQVEAARHQLLDGGVGRGVGGVGRTIGAQQRCIVEQESGPVARAQEGHREDGRGVAVARAMYHHTRAIRHERREQRLRLCVGGAPRQKGARRAARGRKRETDAATEARALAAAHHARNDLCVAAHAQQRQHHVRAVGQLDCRDEAAVRAVDQRQKRGGDLRSGAGGQVDLAAEIAAVTKLHGAALVAADAVVRAVGVALDGGKGDVLHAAHWGGLPQRDPLHLVMQPGVGEVRCVRVGLGELRRRGRRGLVEGTHPCRRLTHPRIHEVRARRDAGLVGVGRRRAAVERIGALVTVGERRARNLAGQRDAWPSHADHVGPRWARGLLARVARSGGDRGQADGGRVEGGDGGDAGVAAAGLVDEAGAQCHALEGGTAGVAVREGQAGGHLGAAGEGAPREREALCPLTRLSLAEIAPRLAEAAPPAASLSAGHAGHGSPPTDGDGTAASGTSGVAAAVPDQLSQACASLGSRNVASPVTGGTNQPSTNPAVPPSSAATHPLTEKSESRSSVPSPALQRAPRSAATGPAKAGWVCGRRA